MNRILPASFLPLLVCLPALAQEPGKGPEHDLRTVAKAGNSVWLIQRSKQEQSFEAMGQPMDSTNDVTHTMQVTVKEVDEQGTMTVEAKIVRVHGSLSMPMLGDVEFDSAKPADGEAPDDDAGGAMGMPDPEALGRAQTALAGKTFTGKVDRSGRVKSLEGVEQALAEARKKAGAGGQMLAGSLNEEAVKGYVESAFGMLPDKPLAVGASWQHVRDLGKAMPVEPKVELTLANVTDEAFEFTATGTIAKVEEKEPAGEGAEGDAMRREMMRDMKIKNGKITGSQRISRKDGFVLDATSTTAMDMAMPSPMGGEELTIHVKQTVTTKRTTADEAMPKPAAGKADAGKDAKGEAPTEPKRQ